MVLGNKFSTVVVYGKCQTFREKLFSGIVLHIRVWMQVRIKRIIEDTNNSTFKVKYILSTDDAGFKNVVEGLGLFQPQPELL